MKKSQLTADWIPDFLREWALEFLEYAHEEDVTFCELVGAKPDRNDEGIWKSKGKQAALHLLDIKDFLPSVRFFNLRCLSPEADVLRADVIDLLDEEDYALGLQQFSDYMKNERILHDPDAPECANQDTLDVYRIPNPAWGCEGHPLHEALFVETNAYGHLSLLHAAIYSRRSRLKVNPETFPLCHSHPQFPECPWPSLGDVARHLDYLYSVKNGMIPTIGPDHPAWEYLNFDFDPNVHIPWEKPMKAFIKKSVKAMNPVECDPSSED